MNTSMPTTPNDLAALVNGGSSSGTTSQLKGMLADRTQSRSASAETNADASSNFESMLDTPAAATAVSNEAVNSPSTMSGRISGEGTAKISDQGRCVLSGELNAVATRTLQIKGIVTNLSQPVALSSSAGMSGAETQPNGTGDTTVVAEGKTGQSMVASARQVANGAKRCSVLAQSQLGAGFLSTTTTKINRQMRHSLGRPNLNQCQRTRMAR